MRSRGRGRRRPLRAGSLRQNRSNMRRAASAVMPLPVSSTLTVTWSSRGVEQDGDRAVGGGVLQGVREQVEKHALDLVGRAAERAASSPDADRASRRALARPPRRRARRNRRAARRRRPAARARARRRRCGRARRGRRRATRAGGRAPAAAPGTPRAVARPSSIASSIGGDRRDGRAQVVARGGDELAARVEEALELARPSR